MWLHVMKRRQISSGSKSIRFFNLFFSVLVSFLGVLLIVATADGQRPVILGDATPEAPDGDNGKEGEQSLEKSAVDFSGRGLTQVCTDHILEDLTNRKQQSRADQVDCDTGS